MELTLLLCIFLAKVITNAVTDVKYASRGETPPRVQLKLAKVVHTPSLDQPHRYGAKDYFRDLWHDSWEDARTSAEERRKKRAEKRAEAAKAAVEPQPAEDSGLGDVIEAPDLDTRPADDEEADLPVKKIRDLKEGEYFTPDGVRAFHAEKITGDMSAGPVTFTAHDGSVHYFNPDDTIEIIEPEVYYRGTRPPVPTSTPAAEPVRLATVTPITRNMIGKETAMNTQSGETTSLTSALNYTSAWAGECRSGVASIDTSVTSLQERGVKGEGIRLLNEAQQKMAELAQLFDSAHAEFSKQTVVQEAYSAVPDAGDKAFVTAQ